MKTFQLTFEQITNILFEDDNEKSCRLLEAVEELITEDDWVGWMETQIKTVYNGSVKAFEEDAENIQSSFERNMVDVPKCLKIAIRNHERRESNE